MQIANFFPPSSFCLLCLQVLILFGCVPPALRFFRNFTIGVFGGVRGLCVSCRLLSNMLQLRYSGLSARYAFSSPCLRVFVLNDRLLQGSLSLNSRLFDASV